METTEQDLGEQAPVSSTRDNLLIGCRIGAGIVFALECYLLFFVSPVLGLWLLPVAMGAIVALAQMPVVTSSIARWSPAFGNRRDNAAAKPGKFARFVMRPMWAAAYKVSHTGSSYGEPGDKKGAIRAGLSLALTTYYFGVALAIFAAFAYVAIIIVVLIAMLFVAFWVLGKVLGGSDDSSSDRNGPSVLSRIASSRQKETLFGEKYVEHRDQQNRVIATDHQKSGFLGMDPHVETRDRDGNLIEESRHSEGFLGLDPHMKHADDSGNQTGTTHSRDGFLGLDPHLERKDTDGNTIRETRESEGFLGLDPHERHTTG